MYHPEVTKRRIKALEERFPDWEPTYYSVPYCRQAKDHLDSLITDDGTLARDLNDDEKKFIRNERLLCLVDFRYFLYRYVKFTHWEGGIRWFTPNVAQLIILDQWAELEAMGRSISMQALKARQLGISTITEIAIAHRVQFLTEFNAVVASSDPDKSAKMAGMMTLVWNNMPWWMRAIPSRYKTGEYYEFDNLSNRLTIEHGTQLAGIARGTTIQAFHLSELSEYSKPSELVDASLMRATHESPWLFRVLESTAKGRRDWWHRTWELNKEGYWSGRAKFCPVFLPWYVGTDLYPTPTEIKTRPVPDDWQPAQRTVEHANKAKEYVQNDRLLSRHLGRNWEMPREQQWFWENERWMAEQKGTLSKFYEEMPASDYEAFQSQSHSVFQTEVLSEIRDRARMPEAIFGIVGPQSEIPLEHQPDRRDIHLGLPPIEVTARWSPTQKPYKYQLVPLRMNGYPNISFENKLIIWEFPRSGCEYGVGVDTGDGIGQDRSVIEILRKGDLFEDGEQVAEYASRDRGSLDLWPLLMAIGTFYSPEKQAQMCIECNRNGETAQHEIRKRGWYNIFRWERFDNVIRRPTNKHGWFTNQWSRPMMLDYFIKASRDGWLRINSPELIDEMATLEKDDAKAKLQAAINCHDDRVMALGIVHFCLSVWEMRGGNPLTAQLRTQRREMMTVAPTYSPGFQGTDYRGRDFQAPVEELEGLIAQYPVNLDSWGMAAPGLDERGLNGEAGTIQMGDITISW